jgi:hypothetical protein
MKDDPSEIPLGDFSFLPLHDGHKPSTRRNAGIWPHLRVRSSPEVAPGASVGTYGQGYLLLGCPALACAPSASWWTHDPPPSPPNP